MTAPQGGSDPGLFVSRAERVGDSWVINGKKRFSSNAKHASRHIPTRRAEAQARLAERLEHAVAEF